MSIKALLLNCSLKSGDNESNTQSLMNEAIKIFDKEGINSEVIRVADYHVAHGISDDEGVGDEWPGISGKIKAADIIVIGTPLWLGEKSSIATQVIERMYGASSFTDNNGQSIFYNKVGGVVVTGNEDGAKHAARSILYGLTHMGLTIPPNVDTYWVGEAGPGASFIEAEGHKNDFTMQHVKFMSYNLIHFARMLKENPIPARGNTLE
ncbi:8-demethyl-8-aminoriboflavin-5'-phosphate (AFP) synthase RosB [Virgibacillus profundi]|uniref:8-demethyl-8-aminoriboflavin-5'-phosphate (AFP) synthase RosB n=1 Tax=Virgibacillus profundi TaxID=2024555 RepID=A0A2A2IBZ2_9BACI|nr:flavodoxin family protein [Virgibacillus profundi]PAV28836.1 8-demethyl-8-aminoriboflavin-5'-phosphate (AFP) synthase RosB [Virgibacillus profundi]PXY53004.1 flavodoxin family protein [Virgibacillus profundi]